MDIGSPYVVYPDYETGIGEVYDSPMGYGGHYDIYEDDYRDINIEDEYYAPGQEGHEIGDFDNGPWLPYTPPPNPSWAGGPQQQVVLAGIPGIYPPTADLTDGYCRFYPNECAKNGNALPLVNTTCLGNGTDERCEAVLADKGLQTALKSVDMSGFGMVVMIAFLLLIGVHFAWDGEAKKDDSNVGKGKDDQVRASSKETEKKNEKAAKDGGKDEKNGKGKSERPSGKDEKDAKDAKNPKNSNTPGGEPFYRSGKFQG